MNIFEEMCVKIFDKIRVKIFEKILMKVFIFLSELTNCSPCIVNLSRIGREGGSGGGGVPTRNAEKKLINITPDFFK